MTRPSTRGMTLLELIVALAITLVVATICTQTLRHGWTARTALRRHADALASARAVLLGIAGEIERALPGELRVARRDSHAAPTVEIGNDAPDPVHVSYRVDVTVLRRAEWLRFAVPDHVATEISLLSDVRRFDVHCLADDEWHDVWERQSLPDAVRITLEIENRRLSTVVVPTLGTVS